jgi:hypothetical protein
MAEGRIDDEMIEISDPNEEQVATEPPHQVVIEYRDRGVPWMLIPPLLLISAVGAVVGYHKLARDVDPPRVVTLATPPAVPAVDIEAEVKKSEPPKVFEAIETKPVEAPGVAVVPPHDAVTLPPAAPAEVVPPPVAPLPEIEPAPVPVPDKPAEGTNFPKATGVGFDPKALEADKQVEAPSADPALTPAAQERSKVGLPDEKDLPREVDDAIMPPDPRLARVRQQERVSEAVKKVEKDRVDFHNELRELCRIARVNYLKEVEELSLSYGMQVDPKIKKLATDMMGKNGRYAGVDRPTRIDVLRAIGFPETLILEDIYVNYEVGRIGERNGPRNKSDAMYRSMLFLLRYAPGQKAAASRAPVARPPQPGILAKPPTPPLPAFLANPGAR